MVRLSSNVAVVNRETIPPVGRRDQKRSPPIARRRQPEVTVRAKMPYRGLTPFGQRPSMDLIVHSPIVASLAISLAHLFCNTARLGAAVR